MKLVNCGCGGEAFVHIMGHELTKTQYYINCEKCDTRTWFFDTEAEAVTVWNKAMGSTEKSSIVERIAKVETVEKPNVYKCSECGQYFHSTAWAVPLSTVHGAGQS